MKRLKGKRVKVIGFADDGALIIHGLKLEYMGKLLQKSINIADNWAKESGLKLSPEKTVAMLFTRKQKPGTPPRLLLGDKELEYVDHTKYLGITLDSRLTFNKHIEDKIKTGKKYLFSLAASIGKTWGPSPEKIL